MPRKEKNYHFIYKTTNLLNGKYYIGMHSTDDLNDGYMGSGRRLKYSINKYGKENHKVEILEFFDSRKELRDREEEIVNLNEIAKEECMNLTVGGKGSFYVINENNLNNKSNQCSLGGKAFSKKLKNDENFKDSWAKKQREGLKKAHREGRMKSWKEIYNWTGKKHSEETKKKMSNSSKGAVRGEKNSQYGTCWITKDKENKKIKKEELEKYISKGWQKGRYYA
jgi:hypothetical protein